MVGFKPNISSLYKNRGCLFYLYIITVYPTRYALINNSYDRTRNLSVKSRHWRHTVWTAYLTNINYCHIKYHQFNVCVSMSLWQKALYFMSEFVRLMESPQFFLNIPGRKYKIFDVIAHSLLVVKYMCVYTPVLYLR